MIAASADELARRVEVEQLVDERLGAVDRREPVRAGPARTASTPTSAAMPGEVVVVERRLALLGAAALVAADRAAVVPGDRLRGGGSAVAASAPSSRAQMISSTTSVRPQVAQRVANRSPSDTFRLDSRRGEADMPWNAASRWRTSGGRRTTSASIRVSGRRLERHRAALAVDGGAGHPAAAADRSATTSPGLDVHVDPGGDEAGRRRRREPLEGRQREARLDARGRGSARSSVRC